MKSVSLVQDVYLKAILYGPPGSTKTRTSASAALDDRTFPALMVSLGGNPLSIRDYARKPYIVELEQYKDLNNLYAFFTVGQPNKGAVWEAIGQPDLSNPKNKIKCLIIDGITNLQRRAANDASDATRLGPGDLPPALTQQHHGQILSRMLFFADKFFALDMHVIMTALEYEQVDATQTVSYRVQLTGQAASEVPSFAYLVGRLVPRARLTGPMKEGLKQGGAEVKVVDSVLYTQPSARWYAKNQYGPPMPPMVDPTVGKLLDAIGVK